MNLQDSLVSELNKIEKELEKVRGCSPLTHGWQTQRYAKASRKWDMLAIRKREILAQLDKIETWKDMFYGDRLTP